MSGGALCVPPHNQVKSERQDNMKPKFKAYKPQYVLKDEPRVKTLDMSFSVTDVNLTEKIRRAFELAKVAGHELDLTFSFE